MKTSRLALLPFAAAFLSGASILAGPIPPSVSAAPQKVWSYSDVQGDERPAVDVVETRLDIKLRGYYRVRVYGSEFIKNETDMVRLFFDTDPEDNGPDYYFDWYFGRNPAERVGFTYLGTTDSWAVAGERVRCPGARKGINFRTDVLTVSIPRACLKRPDAIRWAGFTGAIDRAEDGSMWGDWDDFPKRASFPGAWVA